MAPCHAPAPPTASERGRILRWDGSSWEAVWEGHRVMLRDAKALRCLDVLLRQPGRAIACADIVRELEGDDPASGDDDRCGERARVKIRRLLRSAIDAIRREHPSLGRHLGEAVRTGMRCSYVPRG